MKKTLQTGSRSTASPLRRIRNVPRLSKRPRDAHKGTFGRVLVIGGSRGMIGAPSLAALAALRAGAGLTTVACPRSIQPYVATLCPCATTMPLPEDAQGRIDPRAALDALRDEGMLDEPTAPSVVAMGPGLGRGDAAYDAEIVALAHAFGDDARVPVVLDADALNALHKSDGRSTGWDRALHFRTIITPHPGELARMHDVSTDAVQHDREAYAVRTAQLLSGGKDHPNYRAVVVLKGSGTVVTDGVNLYVNKTGNPGMATGGSGDVLTGVIAGLVAQRMSGIEAAVLGVHVHGLAGDLAAKARGQVSLIASDLVEFLPDAFRGKKR